MIESKLVTDFESWRSEARVFLEANLPPEEIQWKSQEEFTFFEASPSLKKVRSVSVPREFLDQAKFMSFYRDDSNWPLLYRLTWRLINGERDLLQMEIDPDVIEFQSRLKSVSRDHHKMKAFVRFREVIHENKSVFIAWHRPDHKIFKLAAKFFVDRFPNMDWMIFSEDESIAWVDQELHYGPGCPQSALEIQDSAEDLWKTYYGSIFNPARIKVGMMKKEMAVRYWKALPEAQIVQDLLDEAPKRLKEFQEMVKPSARELIPQTLQSLDELKDRIRNCGACTICSKASGPVFGQGPENAHIVLVGEQPGDEEDKRQLPFIGPSGELLDAGLERAGLPRHELYITNAVKGFKWNPKFGRREHRTASPQEIAACRPWLKAELDYVKPKVLVCLGRSSAQSVIGKLIKLEGVRGKFFKSAFAEKTIVLPHPASILRMQDPLEKEAALERFIQELKLVKEASLL